MSLSYKYFASPIGNRSSSQARPNSLPFSGKTTIPVVSHLLTSWKITTNAILPETERQLNEYFAGKRDVFSIPLDMRGTAFQKDVWRALQAIPFGKTLSYSEIAKQLGRPTASRAVGAANGRNPISIFFHVIG